MATTTRRLATEDDLRAMPEDGNKYELVDGEIRVSPAGDRHSALSKSYKGGTNGVLLAVTIIEKLGAKAHSGTRLVSDRTPEAPRGHLRRAGTPPSSAS